MTPKKLIFKVGLLKVMSECNNNIRSFRAYIFRECPKITQGQWYYLKNLCQKTLDENLNMKKEDIITELKEILQRSFEDDDNTI